MFANYDPTLATNQLTPFTAPTPSTNPFSFFDCQPETVTITRDVSVTSPDGETITVEAKTHVLSVQPTAHWGINKVTVDGNNIITSPSYFTGLTGPGAWADANAEATGARIYWYPIAVAMPSQFTSYVGSMCLIQLILTDEWTETDNLGNVYNWDDAASGGGYCSSGLDNSFPYGAIQPEYQVCWPTSSTAAWADDNPCQPFDPFVGYSVDGSTNFMTWLMFNPNPNAIASPNSSQVWVPLQDMTWGFSCNLTYSGLSLTGTTGYTPTSPKNTYGFPLWSQVMINEGGWYGSSGPT
jgi:hypothetical protein